MKPLVEAIEDEKIITARMSLMGKCYTWLFTFWSSRLSSVRKFPSISINTPTDWPTTLALCVIITSIWFALRNIGI